MKKQFVIILGMIMAMPALAQTTTSTTSTKSAKKSNLRKNLMLTIEAETSSKRDGNNEIQGNETYLQIEPGYKVSKKVSILTGASYKMREAGGTLKGAEKANRDHLDTAYLKLLYKPTKFKNNGIADVRLQARVYSDQDDFFKRRYASDGNYQLRAYFGRPLTGSWVLNKYTTYLRYKNYFNNDHVSDFSRDYELRARINPTYRTNVKGLDLGITATYNHIFKVNKLNDEEEIDLDFSIRYQPNQYAAMFRVGVPYMTNNGGEGTLKRNEDAGKDIGYALTLTAYL